MLSIEDVVIRGLELDGIPAGEIVAVLRAMYARLPGPVESKDQPSEFTPG
jgi:hypothetical protein